MFKVGEVVELCMNYGSNVCLITQVLPGQVCAIDLNTANRFFEPVRVDDLTNIQVKDIVGSQSINDYNIVKLADSFREYMENETKKNTKNSEVVESSVETYSVNDEIIIIDGGLYKIVALFIENKHHIILINTYSFTRWNDPTRVEDWHNITQGEMEEAVGSDFSFYKKEI